MPSQKMPRSRKGVRWASGARTEALSKPIYSPNPIEDDEVADAEASFEAWSAQEPAEDGEEGEEVPKEH